MSTLTAKIQLRRDTSANWTSNNPILAAGEVAFTSDVFYTSTDQQRFKIGDGVQTWSQLDYVPEGGAGYNITLSSTTNAFSPADSTTYYFGSARTPSVTSKDNAIIITKTGTIKQIGIVTVINTTLSTTENSTLSVRVRSGGINGSITDTVITNTLKFNATYISTLITGLNISVTEGDAIEMVWLTPAWVTNPVNIFINTNLFIS